MNKYINIKGKLIDLSSPCVMGVINVTPDSFYKKSRVENIDEIANRVKSMIDDGATIIDIGACSSRPGAVLPSEDVEKERLNDILRTISSYFPDIILSLDTFRSSIAEWAVQNYNVAIINDISGGTMDENMFSVISKLKVPYVLMHMRGTPKNMQTFTNYNNVVNEVIYELSEKYNRLKTLGINDIIIDPGFGFSKTLEQNYELLKNLHYFRIFDEPILVGLSRKSMIYKLLNITPDDALCGTTALNIVALEKGTNILRVHDVKEAVQVIKIWKQLK